MVQSSSDSGVVAKHDVESSQRPHTDPHAAAVTALLVADWLIQPRLAANLAQVGLTKEAPVELARTARAIIAIVQQLGGDYLSDQIAVPTDIEARGQAVRASTIKEIEKALPWNRDVRTWLEAVKMGAGLVDLVYDLRTLAELLVRHAEVMRDGLERLPAMLRTASDAIEHALRAGEPPELTEARRELARLWATFVPAYERAATAARVLSRGEGAERTFPPLSLVAAHRRARRTLGDQDPRIANMTLGAEPPASSKSKPSVSPPRDVPKVAPKANPIASKPAALTATGSRRAHRAVLELEVGIESESNFYVGFTENASSAGVFVATYVMQPIGSKVEIRLSLKGSGNSEVMKIHGTVRWQRDATDDGWPGMGVQFDALSKEQESRVNELLAMREPMFYAD